MQRQQRACQICCASFAPLSSIWNSRACTDEHCKRELFRQSGRFITVSFTRQACAPGLAGVQSWQYAPLSNGTALTDRVQDGEPFRQNAGTSLAAKFVFL